MVITYSRVMYSRIQTLKSMPPKLLHKYEREREREREREGERRERERKKEIRTLMI